MKIAGKSTGRTKAVVTVSRAAEPVATRLPMPTRMEIAARAYEIYAKSGHQAGREVEFWLEAERQLQARPKKK